MEFEGYVVLALICTVVLGIYWLILIRRKNRRNECFGRLGFFNSDKEQRKRVTKALEINNLGAGSISTGSTVYVAPGIGGKLIICDLVASVGVAPNSGFSKITLLGFVGEAEKCPNFLIRRSSILETRFELRKALPLKGGWYAWCAQGYDPQLDDIARRLDVFGRLAILRKNGDFLSLHIRNKYLNESKVERLLPLWRQFCQHFIETNQ